MSTKTNFKRVALVAVAALGIGVLTSVAPANAAASTAVLEINGAAGIAASPSATRGTGTSKGLIGVSAQLALTTSSTATMYSTGAAIVQVSAGTDSNSAATISCVSVTGGTIVGTGGDNANDAGTLVCANNALAVTATPSAAGTNMVLKVYDAATANTATTGGTLVAQLTMTVVTTTSAGTLSASDSFAQAQTTTEVAAAAEVTNSGDVATATRIANGGQGYIGFTLHDVNDVAMPATTVVSCSATGGAVCSFTSATFLGTSSAATYDGDNYDTAYVAQGTANAAIDTVVTISVNGAPWITKSFQLLGDLASIELASGLGGVYGEVSATQDGGINLKAKDSLGRLLTSVATSVSASSYNTSLTGFDAMTTGDSTSVGTQLDFTCSSTKGSGELVVSKTNTAGTKITSNALKLYCVGAAYSYSASLDKASYVPGDIATLTITAKDSAGNPASDISTVGAAAAIAGSNMTAVTALATTDTFTAGVKKYTFIVGSTEGSYAMSVSLTDIDDAVTVPYSIKASSTAVSNADVLKAIVSLIASINKQIAALQKALLKK